MLDFMQLEDFMQISRRFHAHFTQNRFRNRSGIVAESFRSRSEILAESFPNLFRPYPGWTQCNMKISCRFHAVLTQNGLRNLSGILAES